MKASTKLETAVRESRIDGRRLWQLADQASGLVYLLGLLAVFCVLRPDIVTVNSATTVFQLSIPLLAIATGMTFCLVCGEVDLSVAGIAGLASTVVALQLDEGSPWPLAVVLALGAGIGAGMVNGFFTAWLARVVPRFPSFLVTMAMLSITGGLAQTIQPAQQAVAIHQEGFRAAFGFTSSLVTSPTTWYALAVVFAAHLVLTRSRFGYALSSVGKNARAAQLVGFNVVRTKFWVLTVSGLLAAVGGVLLAGYVQAGYFAVAKGAELDAIAAAVIGGTALFGGRGSVLGTVVGVLTLGVLNTGLLIMEVPANWQLIAKGAVVVLALATGEQVRRLADR